MTEAQLKAFFDVVREKFGSLTVANVAGFRRVLAEAERRKTSLSKTAYVLATAWWESGKTMAPVEEAFYLGSKADAYRKRLRYYPYHGRGLVQLTWKENYRKAGELCGVDLVTFPAKAMDPDVSCKILFDGMERGWFTGKALADYIDDVDENDSEDLREYSNARRIVNGTDKQVEIGQLALMFERALKQADYGEAEPLKGPLPAPLPPPSQQPPIVEGGGAIIGAGGAAVAAAQGEWLIAAAFFAIMVAALGFLAWRKRKK